MLPVEREASGSLCFRSGRRHALRRHLVLLIAPSSSFCTLSERAARSPDQRQLKGCAHSAPPTATIPQTLTSLLRGGRPRLFRVSGEGKSLSLTSQPLQYTP